MKTLLCTLFLVSVLVGGTAYAASAPAPDFTLNSLDGQSVTLGQFKGKQPVMLFFWTTWCPFCLKEIKAVNAQYQAFADRGLAVLAINAGENAAAVSRLVKNYAISMPMLLDEEDAVTRAYHVLGVPHFVLIDQEGMIVYRGTRFPGKEIEQLCPAQKTL